MLRNGRPVTIRLSDLGDRQSGDPMIGSPEAIFVDNLIRFARAAVVLRALRGHYPQDSAEVDDAQRAYNTALDRLDP